MAVPNDSDRAMGRISPQAYFSGRVSPPNSGILTKAHILDAIARSNDDGCTLDLSNKNLLDVGEAGAEGLAQVGRGEDLLDECRILRCVDTCLLFLLIRILNAASLLKDCSCWELFIFFTHVFCAYFASAIPNSTF